MCVPLGYIRAVTSHREREDRERKGLLVSSYHNKIERKSELGTASPSKKIRRGMSKKSESFSSNTDGSLPFDKDFIRARNISVFSHGNKPRKMRRILLNKKVILNLCLKLL